MLRVLGRLLLSRFTIAFINLLICVPIVLAGLEVHRRMWTKADYTVEEDIVEAIGVILIGWGVVLEERHALREIFGLHRMADERWQIGLDRNCAHFGVGQLVLGLFAEICVGAVRVPNNVINTAGIDEWVLLLGVAFTGIGAILLIRHAIVLLFMSRDIAKRAPVSVSDHY